MQQKIEELRKERLKINVDELKSQKEEYTGKLTEIFNKTSELHPEGMFSEDIFGAPGTEDRKTKWE